MPKLIRDLENLIHLHGAAQTSVWLGYKDTRAVHQWIQRRKVPEARKLLLKQVIARHLDKNQTKAL